MISADQLTQLQALVQSLVTDKSRADQATADANTAHANVATVQAQLTQAQADAGSKDTAEAQADGVVNVDLTNIQSFLATLVAAPSPTTAPTTPANGG